MELRGWGGCVERAGRGRGRGELKMRTKKGEEEEGLKDVES